MVERVTYKVYLVRIAYVVLSRRTRVMRQTRLGGIPGIRERASTRTVEKKKRRERRGGSLVVARFGTDHIMITAQEYETACY